jgi:serine/threonine-protein kinase PpkA
MRTVVVIDDDDAIREAIGDVLDLEGYNVLMGDGTEALALIRRAPRPRIALVDLVMPHVDGWALVASIAEDRELGDVGVICCSAGPGTNLPEQCSAFLRKPFTDSQLLDTLSTLFAKLRAFETD